MRRKRTVKYEFQVVCSTDFMEELMDGFVALWILGVGGFLKSKGYTATKISYKKL